METMGDLKKTVVENEKGEIVACLYQFENGNLHPDSWLCEKGYRG